MKYYLIFESSEPGTRRTIPSFIVENKKVAENFCEEFNRYYFEEKEIPELGFDSILNANQIEIEPKGLYSDIVCPYCGSKHFEVGSIFATAMHCPIIVKDGKVISKDHNISTTEYHCLKCGKTFKK